MVNMLVLLLRCWRSRECRFQTPRPYRALSIVCASAASAVLQIDARRFLGLRWWYWWAQSCSQWRRDWVRQISGPSQKQPPNHRFGSRRRCYEDGVGLTYSMCTPSLVCVGRGAWTWHAPRFRSILRETQAHISFEVDMWCHSPSRHAVEHQYHEHCPPAEDKVSHPMTSKSARGRSESWDGARNHLVMRADQILIPALPLPGNH